MSTEVPFLPPYQAILLERQRQDAKWGPQNHDALYWLGILAEEVGEVATAAIGGGGDIRSELVQVAAVTVAWLECMDRHASVALTGGEIVVPAITAGEQEEGKA